MNIEPLENKNIRDTFAGKIVFFLLCATVVWTTLLYGTVHQPIIALFYIFIVLVMIFWVIDAFIGGVFRFNRSLLQIPLIATIIYGFIQIIPFGTLTQTGGVEGISRTISVEPYLTQLATIHFLALCIFFAAFAAFTDSYKRLTKVVYLIIGFGFLFAFFAILQSFLSPGKIYGIYEVPYAVPFGSFVNRHNFAAYMEMTIAVPLGLLFVGAVEKDKRLLFITAVGLMGIALLLSGSRGGLVALVAEIVLLVIITTQNRSRGHLILKAILAILLVAVIVAGAVLIGGESSLTRVAETASSDDISSDRIHIWTVTLDVIRANLPFGAGLGAFGMAYTPHDSLNGMARVEQAHNDYLEVLANAGVVGLLIGMAFLFLFFRTALKNIKTLNLYRRGVAVGAFAGCFAILVHSLFDFVLHITAVMLMFLTLLTLLVVSGRANPDDKEIFMRRRARKRKDTATVTSIDERREVSEKVH
jgi:O-antigen ligase